MSVYSKEQRHIPVRPNIDQLRHQAKDLLSDIRRGDPLAIEEFTHNLPKAVKPEDAILADAQFAVARSYGIKSWPRLVQACEVVDAIWQDDIERLRELVTKHPNLIHEMARGTVKCNWGPPMSYAANLGRNEIIKLLADLGATDFVHAIGRAMLQGKVETADLLYRYMGEPPAPDDALGGPAYTLNTPGTAFALRIGARVIDDDGKRLAPVDVVLESDSRRPEAKHAILEMYVAHGLELPDTPTMAFHRGRIDLLEDHLRRDPHLLSRTFSHEEIFPPEMGCHNEIEATQGTPLKGTTLLHMCVDYDEMDIARWLLEKGADVNARAAIDEDGFGGHTPLFCTVVSQPNFWMNYQGREQVAPFTQLLLDHGADTTVRASLRKQLHPGYAPRYDTEKLYEYRDVSALEWGELFHAKVFVSEPAMRLIAEVEKRNSR
ncbi:MAG: ankyrin repeat domain-containing protein [Pyrinomonadaceae bacterium]